MFDEQIDPDAAPTDGLGIALLLVVLWLTSALWLYVMPVDFDSEVRPGLAGVIDIMAGVIVMTGVVLAFCLVLLYILRIVGPLVFKLGYVPVVVYNRIVAWSGRSDDQ